MSRFSLLAAALLLGTSAPALAQTGTVGVDLQGIDRAAAPGDSFDDYVNGAYKARTEIPADRTSIGTFVTVAELVEKRNIDIISGAAKSDAAAGTDQRRIGD